MVFGGEGSNGLVILEARLAGDDFLGKVVDHGPGAVFTNQTG
jgi:hypothetical protein